MRSAKRDRMKRERGSPNGQRERIEGFLDENPGATLATIQKELGMNQGTLRYHLEYLESEGRVKALSKGNRKVYFTYGSSGPGAVDPFADLSREQRRLLTLIMENPGISRRQLISATGQSRYDVSIGLRRLMERREIWKVTDGGDPSFEYITKRKLALEMMAVILDRFLDDQMDRETFLLLKKRLEEDMEGS